MNRDRVTEPVRRAVLERDGACVIVKLDRSHECRDAFGTPHSPYDLALLTLEHVKDHAMMAKRAPSDPLHMVAMCHHGNAVEHWGSANRDLLRAYLAGVAAAA